jgi:hypothetical protein
MNDLIQINEIVKSVVNPIEAVEAFNAYQQLAEKIQTPDDIQKIQGKDFRKKSFWRKIQRFFNLRIEIIKEERTQTDNYFTWYFTVRAIAPNTIYCDGTGACSSNEKGIQKTEHNTRAIAETRAKNRAISDLCAFGEVSAEEIEDENNYQERTYKTVKPKLIQNNEVKDVPPENKEVFREIMEILQSIDQGMPLFDKAEQKQYYDKGLAITDKIESLIELKESLLEIMLKRTEVK